MFTILKPSRDKVLNLPTLFALEQDNWNDFRFQTQYQLYLSSEAAGTDEPEFIGTVKILRAGQTKSDGLQLSEDFTELEPDFVSVGDSLDYYQRLNSISADLRAKVLAALNDVVAYPELRETFESEQGWSVSMFRDNRDIDGYLGDAKTILTGEFTDLPNFELDLSFKPHGWDEPLNIKFESPENTVFFNKVLPRRCAVLIGRNGSGKSTLLARLARIAHASPKDRLQSSMVNVGEISPPSVGFMRIITVSYSAFDSFLVPGLHQSDLEQIAKDIERGEGRYIFCGLRDIVREVRDDLSNAEARNQTEAKISLTARDRQSSTHLKSLGQLASEFESLCDRLKRENLWGHFEASMVPILSDSSFAGLEVKTVSELIGDDPKEAFMSWSTGHKITLHVIASIVTHAVERSLVLFDEPETHLHPPLAAALMHGVRIALDKANAFAVIATHSPVVLQETLARHVRVITRKGGRTKIRQPDVETFGENTGTLTYDIFGLRAETTDFHDALDELVDGYGDYEKIDALFSPGLSSQARAFVMTRLLKKDDE